MPPTLALILWLLLLLVLLRFDPAKDPDTSLALWIPLLWMFIIASRLPSQWLGSTGGMAAQSLEEGNPLDRAIFFLLILLAWFVLTLRSFNWAKLFSHNLCLFAFICFALISVVWSDYPLISFKRWFRDLGNYFVILVVLSDPRPLNAVRTVVRRFCYLLIPLCILLNKYFPGLSKQYDSWTGVAMYVGATTSKNMLGSVCMVSGIFFFWDTVTRWSSRKERRSKSIIRVNVAFIVLTLWLLSLSHSATSQICLLIGCMVVGTLHSRWGRRHPTFIRVVIPASFCLYLILAFGLDLNGSMASAVGRDPTLTDRTLIWKAVLSQHTNPIIGTGYESFWLGTRLERVWEVLNGVNEAHNGYLEVYLNLGAIGVFLLAALLFASYRTICKTFTSCYALASFGLGLWTVILFYDVTEAAFKGGLLWQMLLLGGIFLPEYLEARAADGGVAARGRRYGPIRETYDRTTNTTAGHHRPTERVIEVRHGGSLPAIARKHEHESN
jgi:exopolysaccharide production protein ExoQ